MTNKKIGLLFAIGSAFFYGASTITAKMSYIGGGNAITISFYRNFLSIPMLYCLLKMWKIPLKVNRREVFGLFVLGILGGFLTGALLYASYARISVGLTTCIHFSYPIMLACIYVFVFKKKLSASKLIALLMGFGGIWFFLENEAVMNPTGLFTALMSAVSYAIYIVFMDKWNLKEMNGLKLSFYCCIFSSLTLYAFGLTQGYSVAGVLQNGAWMWICGTAVLVSVLGSSMIPVAVKHVGGTVTGIASITEPVTAVVLGFVLLGEPFGIKGFIGAGFVLSAAVILALEKEPEKAETV